LCRAIPTERKAADLLPFAFQGSTAISFRRRSDVHNWPPPSGSPRSRRFSRQRNLRSESRVDPRVILDLRYRQTAGVSGIPKLEGTNSWGDLQAIDISSGRAQTVASATAAPRPPVSIYAASEGRPQCGPAVAPLSSSKRRAIGLSKTFFRRSF